MSDITDRARRYAEFIEKERPNAYIFTDVEILVEEAYEQGARDERALIKKMKQLKTTKQDEMD